MVLSLIPIAITFLWVFLTTHNTAKLAALIATLPRQIQVIQYLEVLSTYTIYWHGIYAKLKSLISALLPVQKNYHDELMKRINKHELKLIFDNEPITFASILILIDDIKKMMKGRVTIQGKNGSGKTSLIILLKQILGEDAYYLPTNSRLFFESTIDNSLSTGQKMKAWLEEIERNILPIKVILLDEWNANLDDKNRKLISNVLDKLSKKCCVIEISHRENSIITESREIFDEEFEIEN
jgi:ABC-type bacteriocin/lantibiotic exporter with double-glycine peptidase domain